MQTKLFFLRIVLGSPFEKDSDIEIHPGSLLIGRAWADYQPDLCFSSAYVSKKHALISCNGSVLTITDLGSKHGTEVNDKPIPHYQPYALSSGDVVTLARKAVVFSVHYPSEYREDTMDLSSSLLSGPTAENHHNMALFVDLSRREVTLDGEKLQIFGKDVELLMLFYENRNRAVSYEEIKLRVWPERLLNLDDDTPDVGNDEINALVYRLRKRLGAYGSCIVNIPRYGYRFDLS